MAVHFDHKATGRNPTVLAGLLACALLAATADPAALPFAVWAGWLACTLALVAVFVLNPVAGMRLDRTSWTCFTSDGRCAIPLCHIDHVRLHHWRDGRLSCRVVLTDGRVLSVLPDCLPRARALTRALRAAGLRVELV